MKIGVFARGALICTVHSFLFFSRYFFPSFRRYAASSLLIWLAHSQWVELVVSRDELKQRVKIVVSFSHVSIVGVYMSGVVCASRIESSEGERESRK